MFLVNQGYSSGGYQGGGSRELHEEPYNVL